MAAYETGYEDELFEHPVGHSLHCGICLNVIKDPVACRHNEHLFCRACITEHLKNHQTCPSCIDPLTVDTLSQAPRGIRNLLAELKIQCKFYDRGCGKFIELGNLDSRLRECGFAPAVCSNDGCQLEVNKQDLLHHETVVCEQRRVKCHSCNNIRQEMDIVKVNLAAMNVKLATIDENLNRNDEKYQENDQNAKAMLGNVAAKVEVIQKQLKEQKESNCQLEAEMKKSLNEITKQLERMTQHSSHQVQGQEEMKKSLAEAAETDREPKIVVAGGWNVRVLNSVEMFSLSNGTWTRLQPMREGRQVPSSVVYNNQIFVVGGYVQSGKGNNSIEKLSANAVQADQTIPWENFPAELPVPLRRHCSVVYNGRLIVIGGYDDSKAEFSDNITDISLVPPYTRKLSAIMPQKRGWHGGAIFDDKIVIVGGRERSTNNSALRTVVMFDITTNECQELAPLPYPVSKMATVKWGDDNVVIIGGRDSKNELLSTVLIYNVKTQKSHILPDMKYKRKGCVAAVVRDTVIVMGGRDERNNVLKSVECFRFDRYTWEELPAMHEARVGATAVVC